MFERFTPEARQVIVFAQEEARSIGHNYIGTEHLLLGLVRAEESGARGVLPALGVELEQARAVIVRTVGGGQQPSEGQIPFTPRAKKVLELSLREALSLGHDYIGPEHIMLGLLREGEGVAVRVLLDLDVDVEALRAATLDTLPEPGPQLEVRHAASAATGWARAGRSVEDAWLDGLAGHLDALGREIRVELERQPDSGDLLLALACAPGTLVARAFRELGVDLDELWGRIETARRERMAERASIERKIAEVRSAKEAAIESQEYQRAAELRDTERALRVHLRMSAALPADALPQIRRRLGIPGI